MRVALVKGNVGRRCGLVVEGLVPGQARPFLLTVEWTFEVRWGFYRLESEPSPDKSAAPVKQKIYITEEVG